MPSYEGDLRDLERLVGRKFDPSELEDILFNTKVEVEVEGERLYLECSDTNRPDLWSLEGLARELRGLLGIETGCPRYRVERGGKVVRVGGVKRRKYIAVGVVKGVELGEAGFSQLIQLQEKIMLTYGRKRKKVAIGTHNLDLVEFPLVYRKADPGERFVPLKGEREMSLREILEKTETGKRYGWIVGEFGEYALLVDAKGEVLSFPPIINSDTAGNISPDTKNILVDVTGTDPLAVRIALNVVVAALVERGGELESVRVEGEEYTWETPDLGPGSISVDRGYVERVMGVSLTEEEFVDLLGRARYDYVDGKAVYPGYRGDIMHPRDVAEDVLIAYGYNRIEPRVPSFHTKGGPSRATVIEEAVKEVLIGTGAQEIATFILTSPQVLKGARVDPVVILENPMMESFSLVRSALFPTVLDFLGANVRRKYPQRVFEVGEVVVEGAGPTGTVTERHVCYAIAGRRADYTEIRQVLEFLLDSLGRRYEIRARDYPWYIPGRSAEIVGLGHMGEVSPEVLDAFGIKVPVALFEVSLWV